MKIGKPFYCNLKLSLCASLATLPFAGLAKSIEDDSVESKRPNILVIVCEDISPYLGCYGDHVAVTPNLDSFARQAVLHTDMYTCVGVSAPSRYSLITGRYSSTDGANYMRVTYFNKEFGVVPPIGVKCYSEFMRQAGYYCTNNNKTDYQFPAPISAWDENGPKAHWHHAPKDKPFFAIFNLGATHESHIWLDSDKPLAVDPDDIIVPPYYPDTKTVRHDHAVLYTCIKTMDTQFQELLSELEQSDRRNNTIVIFYSDNGGPLPRGKREIMDSGTKVPFMIRFPDGKGAGQQCHKMNMFVDIPATILSLAGIKPPAYMHGRPFYGKYQSHQDRKYVFGATDRFDEQIEKRASIRTERYLYIQNYMPWQSVYRPVRYRLSMAMMQEMIQLYKEGKLNNVQSRWFTVPAYEEELYDCINDPYQIHNLAEDKQYVNLLNKMRKAYQKEWINAYNKEWVSQPESYFINRMWPHGKKPVCEKPRLHIKKRKLVIENDLNIYSASYRNVNTQKWQLYVKPVTLNDNEHIVVRLERIGYIATEVTF